MRTENVRKQIEDKLFLDKLYGFAYKRCNHSEEAEDLCSDIVLRILKGINQVSEIENFNSYVWTIAHHTYADYCEKRRKQRERISMESYSENECTSMLTHSIEEYMENQEDRSQYTKIKREIGFLSKLYRDVMIMYYLDEMKVSEIAAKLSLTETTVKQRLFSARNTIKKEVEKMESRDLTLQPIHIDFMGTGSPIGNDPTVKAERMFSQNLIYLCKDIPRSAKELADILNVPMPFIEEELEIQCAGANGEYGLLRKTENGKYIANFIMVEKTGIEQVNQMYQPKVDYFVEKIGAYLKKNEKEILDFPFLNKQVDLSFVAWSLISMMFWRYAEQVSKCLKEQYFSHIEERQEKYITCGEVGDSKGSIYEGFYGSDGIMAYNVCGYKMVKCQNIYGTRLDKHFACGHDIANDQQLLLTLQAIEGIKRDELSKQEQEVAAKAIEAGYLKIKEGYLYPKVLVMNTKDEQKFYELSYKIQEELKDLVEETVDDLYPLIKKLVPKHLLNEYKMFVTMTQLRLMDWVVEGCIQRGILSTPPNPICAEGTWIMVSK